MAQQSRLYRMIEARIEGTLADFIAARRPQTSWAAIAEEIYKLTQVDVSDETVRLWFIDRLRTVVKVG